MAAITKSYGIGDTVYVAYPFPHILAFYPQTRVVKSCQINSSTNEALVSFENGDSVQDGAVQTVFTTAALAATAIVDDVIAKIDDAVNVDATQSIASTAGATALSLGRVSVEA